MIGVYVKDNIQLEFIDTPGLVNRQHIIRHKLNPNFVTELKESLIKADIITIMADVSNRRERTKLNRGILDLLRENRDKESLLILNKVDRLQKKQEILDITHTLTSGIVDGKNIRKLDDFEYKLEINNRNFEKLFRKTEKYLKYRDNETNGDIEQIEDNIGWPNFSQVFMISALHDDGVDDLRSFLLNKAKPQPWLYNADAVTTQKPKNLIIETIRQICLDLLRQEIPYNLYFQIVMWELDDVGNLFIVVDMFCPSKFQSLIIGPKGSTISTIVRKSRDVLCDVFRCDISLKIAVKANKK